MRTNLFLSLISILLFSFAASLGAEEAVAPYKSEAVAKIRPEPRWPFGELEIRSNGIIVRFDSSYIWIVNMRPDPMKVALTKIKITDSKGAILTAKDFEVKSPRGNPPRAKYGDKVDIHKVEFTIESTVIAASELTNQEINERARTINVEN